MRKTWMLAVISVGCLMGLPGCVTLAGGILPSIISEAAFTVISTVFATWLSGIIPAAS